MSHSKMIVSLLNGRKDRKERRKPRETGRKVESSIGKRKTESDSTENRDKRQ